MEMNTGGKFKLTVVVYQYTTVTETLPLVCTNEQPTQITNFLKDVVNKKTATIITMQELHVLRILNHIRQSVCGIKLDHRDVEFYFDIPGGPGTVKINPTDDGDLEINVPGGFFTNRFPELF